MVIRTFLKNKLKKLIKGIFNNSFLVKENHLSTRYMNNGLLQCKWQILDEIKATLLEDSNLILCIRMYDMTNYQLQEKSTCVMKEIEVKKRSKDCYLKPPVNKGRLLLEIGYRKLYGEWFVLASSILNLKGKINIKIYSDDSWFYQKSKALEESEDIHERVYKLSKKGFIGGSEKANERSSDKII